MAGNEKERIRNIEEQIEADLAGRKLAEVLLGGGGIGAFQREPMKPSLGKTMKALAVTALWEFSCALGTALAWGIVAWVLVQALR